MKIKLQQIAAVAAGIGLVSVASADAAAGIDYSTHATALTTAGLGALVAIGAAVMGLRTAITGFLIAKGLMRK